MTKKTNFFLAIALFSSLFAHAQSSKPVFSNKDGAIKGYDPVAYFTENKPVKGAENITFDWNGATWHFTSVAHRDTFAKNPAQYAPQYGGYCAYGWAQGYPAKTEPEAWRIVDGKLYLNYDLSIQRKWEKNRDAFIKTADHNWANAKH